MVFKTLNSDRLPIIHPSPRMTCIHYGANKGIAVQNVEQISDRPLKDNLLDFLYLKKHYPDHPIIASIMGFFTDEWDYLAKAAEDNGADMLELNFSCPHMCIEGSGHKVGQAFHLLEGFTEAVKKAVSIPVMAKMTPNITDMTEPAHVRQKRRRRRHLRHQHRQGHFRRSAWMIWFPNPTSSAKAPSAAPPARRSNRSA